MVVLSLFDGISVGHLALERAGLKVDKYYASEISKSAIKITNHNYPETIQLGDVCNWRDWDIDWSSISMLIGGSPCFVGDTLVLTRDGYKQIKDVKIGDFVLTHKNTYEKVIDVIAQGKKNIIEMHAMNFDSIKTTLNHKFLVRRRYRKYNRIIVDGEKKGQSLRLFDEPEWKTIEELMQKDEKGNYNYKNYYVGNAINQNSIIPKWGGVEVNVNQFIKKNIKELDMTDENLWYLAGRYLGDGWLKKGRKGKYRNDINGVVICCNKDEKEDFIKKISKKYSYTSANERTVIKLHFTSTELGAFFSQFGTGAKNKRIPGFVFDMPINLMKALLDGYFESDGTFEKGHDTIHITTVSKELAYGIAQCISKVYNRPCATYINKVPNKKIIEGREVNQNNFYTSIFHILKRKQDKAFYEDGYTWYPITDIKDLGVEEDVYDISVENAHSFTANNCIVHNCQNISLSGDKTGLEGSKSSLFFVYRDILNYLKSINPNILFLLENVKGKKEVLDTISREMGVEPVRINSNLVSAQNRDRYYWTNINGGVISQPLDKGIVLNDILRKEDDGTYPLSVTHYKAFLKSYPNWKISERDGKSKPILASYYKQPPHCPYIRDSKSESGYRRLSPIECERLQTLPDDYTNVDNMSYKARIEAVGNSWTVDIISHIFSHIDENIDCKVEKLEKIS